MRLVFVLALLAACTGKEPEDTGPTDDADGDGLTAGSGDCDDSDAAVHPDADEVWYDGIDQNCDGNDDDQDGDGATIAVDCDDLDNAIGPQAEEYCDGIDNDCDGTADVGAADMVPAYWDSDGDGYGYGEPEGVCPGTPGWVENADDCDDAHADANPGVPEVCDDLDNNCDGQVNEGTPDEVEYWFDADGDSFGDPDNVVISCETPIGFVSDATDCDDHDAAAHPGAEETCDPQDRDCDGDATLHAIDAVTYYPDADGDLYGDPAGGVTTCDPPEGYVESDDDCDDTDAASNPFATEVCDLQDNDCDGAVDDDATVDRTYYADTDADGFGDPLATTTNCGLPSGYARLGTDCDDTAAAVSPVATEVCNSVDDDCDTFVDDAAADATTWYTDADADGYGDPDAAIASCEQPADAVEDATDCDDDWEESFPGGVEVCDAHDNDCDGTVDGADATDAAPLYLDADDDGHGTGATVAMGCDEEEGYAVLDDDCDDVDEWVHPGALEFCDEADNDCDGETDEDAIGARSWWADADGDGDGDGDTVAEGCEAPAGYVENEDDCDDTDPTISTAGVEVEDGVDQDCDEMVDEDFVAIGDVIVSEIMRQPHVGTTATVVEAQWFELYNTSARTIDLSGWLIERTSSIGTDEFLVDPEDAVVLEPGDYVVVCKTDDYAAVSTASSTLVCDYYWGDETALSTWSGTYHDNTFNLQRDEDTLSVALSDSGTVIDSVHWTYDSVSGYWPRDATLSTSLDPALLTATDNDAIDSWCSSEASSALLWYDDGAGSTEYGTPGAANGDCSP